MASGMQYWRLSQIEGKIVKEHHGPVPSLSLAELASRASLILTSNVHNMTQTWHLFSLTMMGPSLIHTSHLTSICISNLSHLLLGNNFHKFNPYFVE